MVFVPNRAGRIHCPEEWTGKEEFAVGTLVLFDAVLDLDRGNWPAESRLIPGSATAWPCSPERLLVRQVAQ